MSLGRGAARPEAGALCRGMPVTFDPEEVVLPVIRPLLLGATPTAAGS